MFRYFLLCAVAISSLSFAAEKSAVEFQVETTTVEVFDPVEFTAKVSNNEVQNPFSDSKFTVVLKDVTGAATSVAGFCDQSDGRIYRARFLPQKSGEYKVEFAFLSTIGDRVVQAALSRASLTVKDGKRRGPVRIDPAFPHHFVWQGTGEHYFWNGTTTYWLLGVQDDKRIEAAIDRLASLKVNRIRVALNARTKDGSRWYEPQIVNSKDFQFRVDPWVAHNPESVDDPQFDTTRFNLVMWQKVDRLVNYARQKDVVVSLIFHLDGADKGVDPFNGGKKDGEGYTDYGPEEEYYRYAVARLSAYSNVMWDITNEWHLFRNEAWVDHFGKLIRASDASNHLISVHGRGDFPFYQSSWADFALYQCWDENGSDKFLRWTRTLAEKAGRPMPQINEEYGYEDHYPGPWGGGRKKPARSADNRRRLAWEMTMAGGYQTTGERADEPGQGGWVTGLGNDEMTMLRGYAHLVSFFTAFEWWKTDPQDGLADKPALVLAEPNKRYVVYALKGEEITVKVPKGAWVVKPFNPRAGEWLPTIHETVGDNGLIMKFTDSEDWAAIVER